MSSEELKPCPFCGGTAEWTFWPNPEFDAPRGITCTKCRASIRDGYLSSYTRFAAAWNKRDGESQAEQRGEERGFHAGFDAAGSLPLSSVAAYEQFKNRKRGEGE